MEELDLIRKRYERRKFESKFLKQRESFYFNYFVQSERELIYYKILKFCFLEKKDLKFIEIGAGDGSNLHFFLRYGIKPTNIFANELLIDRYDKLKERFHFCNTTFGDASQLNYKDKFDIVFQSTVFTSVLNEDMQYSLALKMWEMKKKDGIILWYDFIYNNPSNKDVRGVGRRQIKKLFPSSREITFYRVTLYPFLARKVGKHYHLINSIFPFLRTHVVAVIR